MIEKSLTMDMLSSYFQSFVLLSLIGVFTSCFSLGTDLEEDGPTEYYKIEGQVFRPEYSSISPVELFANTKVFTNTGHYGFLR